jgi:hypothetical protein
VETTSTP